MDVQAKRCGCGAIYRAAVATQRACSACTSIALDQRRAAVMALRACEAAPFGRAFDASDRTATGPLKPVEQPKPAPKMRPSIVAPREQTPGELAKVVWTARPTFMYDHEAICGGYRLLAYRKGWSLGLKGTFGFVESGDANGLDEAQRRCVAAMRKHAAAIEPQLVTPPPPKTVGEARALMRDGWVLGAHGFEWHHYRGFDYVRDTGKRECWRETSDWARLAADHEMTSAYKPLRKEPRA